MSLVDPRLRVHVDRELCIGSGNCVHFAPGVFELDDDGIATVTANTALEAANLAATEGAIAAAVAQCPTAAINFDPEG